MKLYRILPYTLFCFICFCLSCSNPEENPFTKQEYVAVVNKLGNSISIINLDARRVIKTISVGQEPHEISVSKDFKYLAVSNYKSPLLSIIEISSFKKRTIKIDKSENLHGLNFIGDSHTLVLTNEGYNELLVYDITKNKITSRVSLPDKKNHHVVVSNSGQYAYISNYESGTVSKIDLSSNQIEKTVYSGEGAEGNSLNTSNSTLWVVNRLEETVSVFNTSTMDLLGKIACENGPVRVAVSPDDQTVVVVNSEANSISVIDAKSYILQHTIKLKLQPEWLFDVITKTPKPVGVIFHPNKELVFLSASNAHEMYTINLNDGEIIDQIAVGKIPDGIVYFCKNEKY